MTLPGTGPVHDDDGEVLDQIRLVGLRATGHHGVFEHERRDGQQFVADVVVHLDTRPAAAGDALAHTVHYGELAERVTEVLGSAPADLLETVAERIAAVVLSEPAAVAVDVTLHKPEAPITVPFDDVVVAVRRSRTRPPVVEVPRGAAAEPALPEPTQAALPPAVAPGDAPAPEAVVPVVAPVVLPPVALPDVVAHAGGEPAGTVEPVAAEEVPAAHDGTGSGVEPSDEEDAAYDALRAHDRMDEIPASPVDVVLSLGSNLGDPQQTLRDAISALAAIGGIEVLDVSPLARTAPVGGVDQNDFLNAVVVARTSMSARELLHACQDVENSFGRVREQRWGPRTLDVDVIVYGALTDVAEDLELPHPRAHERAFVLEPWSQVQPDAILPGLGGGPVAQLAATAPDRAGIRWLALDWLGDEPGPGSEEHAPRADEAAPVAEQAPPVVPAAVAPAAVAPAAVAPVPVAPPEPSSAVGPVDGARRATSDGAVPSVPDGVGAPVPQEPTVQVGGPAADVLPGPSSAPTQSTPTNRPEPATDSWRVAVEPSTPVPGRAEAPVPTPPAAPATPESFDALLAPTPAQPAVPPAQPAVPPAQPAVPPAPPAVPVGDAVGFLPVRDTHARQEMPASTPTSAPEPAGGLLTGVPLSFPPVSGGTRAVQPPRTEPYGAEPPRAAGDPSAAAAPDAAARPAPPLFPPTREEPPTR